MEIAIDEKSKIKEQEFVDLSKKALMIRQKFIIL